MWDRENTYKILKLFSTIVCWCSVVGALLICIMYPMYLDRFVVWEPIVVFLGGILTATLLDGFSVIVEYFTKQLITDWKNEEEN